MDECFVGIHSTLTSMAQTEPPPDGHLCFSPGQALITPVRIGELRILTEVPHGKRRLAQGLFGDHRVFAKQVPRSELIREVLCNLLAQAVSIPIPNCFVLSTDQDDGDRWFASERSGTDYLRTFRGNQSNFEGLKEGPSLWRLVAFDTWIGNEDRTPKNLLFQAPGEFLPIDHGEALPSGMKPNSRYRNRLARHLIAEGRDSPQALAAQVRRAMADFADVDFSQILIAGLPEGWGANPEFAEWCRVLRERLRYLPDLIEAEFKTGQGSTIWEFQRDD